MRKIKKFLAILISIPLVLSAEGLIPCKGTKENPCTACDLFVLFRNVLNFLLFTIVPLLAAIIIAWGAFRALLGMAQGKVEEWKKGKDVLIAVIIGLVIIYSAWLLVGLFLTTIGVTSIDGWNPQNWFKINCTP
jgi:cation transport ATPase